MNVNVNVNVTIDVNVNIHVNVKVNVNADVNVDTLLCFSTDVKRDHRVQCIICQSMHRSVQFRRES